MNQWKYVILGGGMAAGYAAKELAARGLKPGELAIVSAETVVPYERPPLSKGFLAGKEDEAKIRINPVEFYGERGIELVLGTEVAGVDPGKRSLQLRSGKQISFEKLMVATGAIVRTLEIPGADLAGIFYLRSLEDSKRMRLHAEDARTAVVVGSGFIGMEVASVLAQRGIETTMVLREERIWPKFFTPSMSKTFERYFSERGVRFVKGAALAEVKREQGLKVITENGKAILCDILVAGIGVRPATDVLMDSEIEMGDGVVVNPFLETSEPGIYAAGDVANYEDTLFGVRRRAEHWDNAVSQGEHCARVMGGERKPFVHVPYFFSDVFDLSYEYWGDGAGADEVVERGDVNSTSFSVWWLRDKRVVAAFAMNRPDEERNAAPQWIESKRRIGAEELRGDRWPTA
jgi:NADPH-dependent 2,4-dienoyl-CoA reductase/sulfur reductase-like enzyme